MARPGGDTQHWRADMGLRRAGSPKTFLSCHLASQYSSLVSQRSLGVPAASGHISTELWLLAGPGRRSSLQEGAAALLWKPGDECGTS